MYYIHPHNIPLVSALTTHELSGVSVTGHTCHQRKVQIHHWVLKVPFLHPHLATMLQPPAHSVISRHLHARGHCTTVTVPLLSPALSVLHALGLSSSVLQALGFNAGLLTQRGGGGHSCLQTGLGPDQQHRLWTSDSLLQYFILSYPTCPC